MKVDPSNFGRNSGCINVEGLKPLSDASDDENNNGESQKIKRKQPNQKSGLSQRSKVLSEKSPNAK